MIPDAKNKWRYCRCMTCNIPYEYSVAMWCGENVQGNLMWQCEKCYMTDQQAYLGLKGSEKTIGAILGGK